MADEATDDGAEPVEPITLEVEVSGPVKTLDLSDEHVLSVNSEKRIIGLRVVRYNEVVEHPIYGRLLFEPGAFVKRDSSQVRLRMDHQNPPTGVGVATYDDAIGPRIDFRVSKTQRGDEQLTLARDGVSRGTSPGFYDVPGRPQHRLVDGQMTTVYPRDSAVLAELSTTWTPTFEGDGVVYVLSKDGKETGQMAETQDAPVITPGIDYDAMAAANAAAIQQVLAAQTAAGNDGKLDALLSKFDEVIEAKRADFAVGQGEATKPKFKDWFGVTLRRLAGDTVTQTELHTLALDDVVTGEQPGLVPEVFTADYDDIINRDRPFLSSTRQVRPPATGNTMTLPIITTRAIAGTQAGNAEKGAVTTTAPKVGTGSFAAKTVLAGADISVQMILRADRSFLDLLDEEFGEAYALDCELKAITALLTGYTDSAMVAHAPTDGGVMDAEDPNFGDAFKNSVLASRRRPTHAWMSVDAVAAFIDAKNPTTNGPLWSNLAAAFTAGGGEGGVLSGLTPIYVPALDDNDDVDIIIGPSRGFVWAEDPALRLQADNPGQAGRDIVLAGMLFPAPRYADAFTTYVIGS